MDLRKTNSDTILYKKKKITRKNISEDNINYNTAKKIYSAIYFYLSSLSQEERNTQTPNLIIKQISPSFEDIDIKKFKSNIKKWSTEIHKELKKLDKRGEKSQSNM